MIDHTDTVLRAPPEQVRPLLETAIRGRCPRCGIGALFRYFMSVRECCSHCELDLRGHDVGDGAAVFAIFFVGTVITLGALLLEVWVQPAYWVHMVTWPFLTIALSLFTLRPVKALLIALQYRHRSTELD